MSCEKSGDIKGVDPTGCVKSAALLDSGENIEDQFSEVWSALSSDTAFRLFVSVSVIFLIFLFTGIFLKHLVKWRIRRCLLHTPNKIIFAGQVLLAAGLLFSVETVKYVSDDIVYGFHLYSVSCYLMLGSMFLSYDSRRPPSYTVGFFVCLAGLFIVSASLFIMYKKMFAAYKDVVFITGFNVFTVGSAYIAMNCLKERVVTFQALKSPVRTY